MLEGRERVLREVREIFQTSDLLQDFYARLEENLGAGSGDERLEATLMRVVSRLSAEAEVTKPTLPNGSSGCRVASSSRSWSSSCWCWCPSTFPAR